MLDEAFELVDSSSGQQLYHAIEYQDEKQVVVIIKESPPDFNTICKTLDKKENLLLLARNNLAIMTVLLEKYSDEIDMESKTKAFLGAVLQKKGRVVTLLLENCGAKISVPMKAMALMRRSIMVALIL